MSKMSALSSVVVLAAISGSALAQFNPVNNSIADRSALGINSSLVPLDLTGLGYLDGVVNVGNNAYEQAYVGLGGNFSGTLRAEVFGNVGTPSAALNDVVIVYTFQSDAAAVGVESFDFGVDTSKQIDFSRLSTAMHGRIDADTAVELGQLDPIITIFDNNGSNDTFLFDWNPPPGNSSSLNRLGGSEAETFTWYIRTTGDVKLNFVDVRITDFGSTTIKSLSLVDNPGQPDLNVPAPAAVALFGAAFAATGLRRRRS